MTQPQGVGLAPPPPGPSAASHLSVRTVVTVVFLAGAAACVLLTLVSPAWTVSPDLIGLGQVGLVALYVALSALAEIVYVPVRHGEGLEELTFFEILMVGGVLLYEPTVALLAPLLGFVIAESLMRRELTKTMFNLGSYALAGAALVGIYGLMAGGSPRFSSLSVVALLLGALAFAAINFATLTWILHVAEGVPARELIREQYALSLGMALASVGVAISALALGVANPILIPFSLVPAVALWYAYQSTAAHTAATERSRRMIDLSTALATAAPMRDLVPAASDALRRVFAADDIRVVVDSTAFVAAVPGEVVAPMSATDLDRALVQASSASVQDIPAPLLPPGWQSGHVVSLDFGSDAPGALAIGATDSSSGLDRVLPWATGTWHLADVDKPVLTTVAGSLASAVRAGQHFAALRDETAKLSAVVDHATDGIAVFDNAGQVSLWSPAMTTITGLTEAAAEAGADAPGSDVLARLRAATEPATPQREQAVTVVRPDTDSRELDVSVVALDDEAGMRVVTVRDVTQQRRVERMKSDFIATVSHELRTPITPIKGYAQLLSRRWERMPEQKRADVLATIEDRADHLSRLVDDLLLASRVSAAEHARLDVSLSDVDLADLVTETVRAFPDLERRIQVSGTTTTVRVDRVRAIQCLSNLIGNAGKYSPAESVIAVEFHPSGGGRWATVDVTDHGRGIPAEELDKVFERFYRVEDPMTMTTGGSGLGLFISRELARAMSGDISVESTVGAGSRFRLQVPTAEGAAA